MWRWGVVVSLVGTVEMAVVEGWRGSRSTLEDWNMDVDMGVTGVARGLRRVLWWYNATSRSPDPTYKYLK